MPSKPEGLLGVRVALLEARMSDEMGELVRRYGGTPRMVPAVREAPVDCTEPVAAFLEQLEELRERVVVFLTGVGAAALFQEADRQGRLPFLLKSLERATLVCRGPKPTAAIKKQGLSPSISAREPYTSQELLDGMATLDLRGVDVMLVHYGEPNEWLAEALREHGARLDELCLYEWRLPDDLEPMRQLIRDVLDGGVDAVVFTSQIQGRHLLKVAQDMQIEPSFICALNARIVVAAIGPICRVALQAAGINPHVVPENPKMGPLIAALAEHYSARRSKVLQF